MEIYNNFIGIDIGKFEFVVNIHGSKTTFAYSNNLEGFSQLFEELKDSFENALVVLEVTGGYERLAVVELQKRNVVVHRANGRQVKSFIRSYGIIGKSDNIDAKALALYASDRHASLKPYKQNEHDLLRELNERRADLIKIRTQEINRAQAPSSITSHASFEALLDVLNTQIVGIDKEIVQLINSDPALKRKVEILDSVPGIGEITARAILAQMPEIGTLNHKQIASLAGVAPHPNESGTNSGYRRTRGGRREMRPILFMAALSATHSKSKLGLFYNKLIAKGKSKMCALVAVMRKMIVIGNARIKANTIAEA